MLKLIKNDPWLEPYQQIIQERYDKIQLKEKEITKNNTISLSDFANGYIYFGLNKTLNGWVIREWAPNATEIFLIGSFNDWKQENKYKLNPIDGGVWELHLNSDDIHHLDYYKLYIKWDGGSGDRIPAWCRYVVQDEQTHLFSGQVWEPENKYEYKNKHFTPSTSPLLIYESHIGMGTEKEDVGTYNEFRENILPRVKEKGYNTIQLMAIQEHPYYGSFGYHVSSFFASSSRFGSPDELRQLIDEAHGMGIAIIMDIVHSHAVKNEAEGLGRLDGSYDLYFHGDDRRVHPAWDSLCFNYGKDEVMHFLLSNCKYWLEEFKFDGYRFDGVTSMLYYSHGLEESFVGYENYYNGKQDFDAICYLTLANKLIHEVNPNAITVAEEVSGMPGLALSPEKGGYGFDYRMAMNIPDFWIKTIKELKHEDWDPSAIFWEVTNRRAEEKTVSYVESHDQALVGDKTVIFRLIDKEMYWHMSKFTPSMVVDRGIALHKMIRLVTATTINGGYLTFMGNEFGHPEWVDFPREGNDWSYKYARRQWSLNEDTTLKYHYMGDFDKEMISLVKSKDNFQELPIIKIWEKKEDNILAYMRGDFLFIYNFNPTQSFTDYGMLVPEGEYKVILNTDEKRFGGFGLTNDEIHHFSHFDELYKKHNKGWLKVYIPAHTAVVLKKVSKQLI